MNKAALIAFLQTLGSTATSKELFEGTSGAERKFVMSQEFSIGRGVRSVSAMLTQLGVSSNVNSSSVKTKVAEASSFLFQGDVRSDAEVAADIDMRFETLETMTDMAIEGANRAMIVAGPAGLGKSFTVEAKMDAVPEEDRILIKGFCTPQALYRTLYNYRAKRCVICFDDADSIFSDEVTLNLLKAACDSSDKRRICWLSSKEIEGDDGEFLPSSFEFCASIIFITNTSFDAVIERGGKMAPHFSALISRAYYVSLGIETPREYMIRIRQVVAKGMLDDIAPALREEVVTFVDQNRDGMRELSLRVVKKIAALTTKPNWKQLATVTCMR